MSNGDNRLYLYENVVDLVIMAGDLYVDNRPMNNRNLKAHKGVTNDIYFQIRNRDRKLQNVFSETLRAYLVNPSTKKRLLTRILEDTSEVGKVKLVLSEGDLAQIDPGLYQVFITRSVDELTDRPVYTDQNNSLRFDIEVTDQVGVQPVPTQEDKTFFQTQNTSTGDAANVFVSSAMYGNLDRNFTNAQHTVAIYPQQYTGQVLLQASSLTATPSTEDDSMDWYTIKTLNISDKFLATGNIIITESNIETSTGRVSSLGLTSMVIVDHENADESNRSETISFAGATTLSAVATLRNSGANTTANVVASVISTESEIANNVTYKLQLAGNNFAISGDSVTKLGLAVDTYKKSDSNVVTSTFQTNCNWVRCVSTPTSGSLEKIQLRN